MPDSLAQPIEPAAVPTHRLAEQLGAEHRGPASAISTVASSTAAVQPGSLFVALPGNRTHGARFAEAARAAGATAVLTDPAGADEAAAAGLPVLVVDAPRTRLGEVARLVYRNVPGAPKLIGVTGTDGKTTTTYVLHALVEALGLRGGLSGTVERRVADRAVATRDSGRLTTPEADYLHGLVARMRDEAVDVAAIEVSAQAIERHRVDELCFDVAIFTNLSHDHLDDYGTMDRYYATKLPLFARERSRRGVVAIDDEWGARLAREATAPVTTVSMDAARGADWTVAADEVGIDRTEFELVHRDGRRLRSAVNQPGWFVALDTALAAVALLELGLPIERLQQALDATDGLQAAIPGRLDLVEHDGPGPRVYVDYGHTPASFRTVLRTLRRFTDGRLLMVFGADGDRDAAKRPDMARSAALADVVVVTDYNPRFEDPAAIRRVLVDTIATEFPDREVHEVADSAEGIALAVALAADDDIVFVGGHGHRRDVEVRGELIPYSVKDAVRAALDARRGADAEPGGTEYGASL